MTTREMRKAKGIKRHIIANIIVLPIMIILPFVIYAIF